MPFGLSPSQISLLTRTGWGNINFTVCGVTVMKIRTASPGGYFIGDLVKKQEQAEKGWLVRHHEDIQEIIDPLTAFGQRYESELPQ